MEEYTVKVTPDHCKLTHPFVYAICDALGLPLENVHFFGERLYIKTLKGVRYGNKLPAWINDKIERFEVLGEIEPFEFNIVFWQKLSIN